MGKQWSATGAVGMAVLRALLLTAIALLALPALAYTKFQGYAERGGQIAITALTGSNIKAQRSFPFCLINVYIDGTTTPATIYSDSSGTPIPGAQISADSVGHFQFWGDSSAVYALRFSPIDGYAPWTIGGFSVSGGPLSSLALNGDCGSSLGTIYKGSAIAANRFIHSYFPCGINGVTPIGHNLFAGIGSGNFTMAEGLSITGATNTSPIVITASASPGVFTGTQVTITGVAGNTAANGTWTVTLTDPACCFSLNGSTGNGAYTSNTGSFAWAYQAADNLGLGVFAGQSLTVGSSNTLLNVNAGHSITSGWGNFFGGVDAGATCDVCYEDIGIGSETLALATSGHTNTAVGAGPLRNCTTCTFTTAFGADALQAYIDGTSSAATGTNALNFNQHGSFETADGSAAGFNHQASNGTFIGSAACQNNVTGDMEVCVGRLSGSSHTAGTGTFLGGRACPNNISGDGLVCVGYLSGSNDPGGTHNTWIGSNTGSIFGNTYNNCTVVGYAGQCYANNLFEAGNSSTTLLSTWGHIREDEGGRSSYIGQMVPVAYSAGNFTANGGGTFGVDSGDQSLFATTRWGDRTMVDVTLASVTITGSPTDLAITLPFTSSSTYFSVNWQFCTATCSVLRGFIISGQNTLHLQNLDGSAFTNSTNTVTIAGQITASQ